jgi:hypothetical protein
MEMVGRSPVGTSFPEDLNDDDVVIIFDLLRFLGARLPGVIRDRSNRQMQTQARAAGLLRAPLPPVLRRFAET